MAEENFVSNDDDYQDLFEFGSEDMLDNYTVVKMGRDDHADGIPRDEPPFEDEEAVKLWLQGWDEANGE